MTGSIVLATNWTNIYSNRYNIYVTRSGQVKALPCQCMDGIDNDGDNLIDRNGLDTDKNGSIDISADSQCASAMEDRKSTRLNSSHSQISYAVFCLKKKKKNSTLFLI